MVYQVYSEYYLKKVLNITKMKNKNREPADQNSDCKYFILVIFKKYILFQTESVKYLYYQKKI